MFFVISVAWAGVNVRTVASLSRICWHSEFPCLTLLGQHPDVGFEVTSRMGDELPIHALLVGQIRQVALGLLLNFGHLAKRRWGPHHELESRPNLPFNGFSNGL
jgi:hypothetical protein